MLTEMFTRDSGILGKEMATESSQSTFPPSLNFLTPSNRRNGDHFEGKWVNDKREGQGSYFYSSKNKVFVGEWVND